MRITVLPNVVGVLGMDPKGLDERVGGIGNQRKNQDHPDYSIVVIRLKNRKDTTREEEEQLTCYF